MLVRHLTCRNQQEVAGPFALSSFQNEASGVYQAWCAPELSQCSADEFAHYWEWGEADKLTVTISQRKHKVSLFFRHLSWANHHCVLSKLPEKLEMQREWWLTCCSLLFWTVYFVLFHPYNNKFWLCLFSFNKIVLSIIHVTCFVWYSWLPIWPHLELKPQIGGHP